MGLSFFEMSKKKPGLLLLIACKRLSLPLLVPVVIKSEDNTVAALFTTPEIMGNKFISLEADLFSLSMLISTFADSIAAPYINLSIIGNVLLRKCEKNPTSTHR